MAKSNGVHFEEVHGFLKSLFQNDWHAKRVYSLANATLGVMTGASLAIHVIGQSLEQARGLLTKHAVKQVDRLLSNRKIDVWEVFAYWVPQIVGNREEILVAMTGPSLTRTGNRASCSLWSPVMDAARR